MRTLDELPVEKWLELNARLQQKKEVARQILCQKGILKKGGKNDYDHYTYFSEAQYKELFTEIFATVHLDMKFTELEYGTFEGPEKQANGRMPRLEFALFDTQTGFYETTVITGEGIDKGDKAGYKAYTGALKYFLADTFMVATGDDPEQESPDAKMNTKKPGAAARPASGAGERKASNKQLEILRSRYTGENMTKLLTVNGLERLEDMTMAKASELISKLPRSKPATASADAQETPPENPPYEDAPF